MQATNKARHGDAYYIAASPPFRSRACWLALLAQAVSIFGRLSARALASGLVAKPPVLVKAKAGKVAVGVGCQHHRQNGCSWRAPVAGPSVLNGNWAGGF